MTAPRRNGDWINTLEPLSNDAAAPGLEEDEGHLVRVVLPALEGVDKLADDVKDNYHRILDEFAAIAVERRETVMVGIVGEIFVKKPGCFSSPAMDRLMTGTWASPAF